jgi:hypothetical protein
LRRDSSSSEANFNFSGSAWSEIVLIPLIVASNVSHNMCMTIASHAGLVLHNQHAIMAFGDFSNCRNNAPHIHKASMKQRQHRRNTDDAANANGHRHPGGVQGSGAPQASTAPSSKPKRIVNFGWNSVEVPPEYLALNWPIRLVCSSEDLRLVAVAGRRGFVIGNLQTNRWRCFGNLQQEQNHVVHNLLWFTPYCVLAISMAAPLSQGEVAHAANEDGGRVLQFSFYPRHHLDEDSVLHRFAVPLPRHTRPAVSDGILVEVGAVVVNGCLPTVGHSFQETAVHRDGEHGSNNAAIPSTTSSSNRVVLHRYWLYIMESPHYLTVSRVTVFVEENMRSLATKATDLDVQHLAKVCLYADIPPLLPTATATMCKSGSSENTSGPASPTGVAPTPPPTSAPAPPRIQSPIKLIDCVEVRVNALILAILDAKDDLYTAEVNMTTTPSQGSGGPIVVEALASLSSVASNIFHILHQDYPCSPPAPASITNEDHAFRQATAASVSDQHPPPPPLQLTPRPQPPHRLCSKPLRCYFLMGSRHHQSWSWNRHRNSNSSGNDGRHPSIRDPADEPLRVCEESEANKDAARSGGGSGCQFWLWTPALATSRFRSSWTSKGATDTRSIAYGRVDGDGTDTNKRPLFTSCERFGSSFTQRQICNGPHPMMRGLMVTTQFEQVQWQLKGGSFRGSQLQGPGSEPINNSESGCASNSTVVGSSPVSSSNGPGKGDCGSSRSKPTAVKAGGAHWPIFEMRTTIQTALHQVLRHFVATLHHHHYSRGDRPNDAPFCLPDFVLAICRERALPIVLFSGNNGCVELLVESALQENASERRALLLRENNGSPVGSRSGVSFGDVFLDFAFCVLLDHRILTDKTRLALIARLARKIVDADKLRVLFAKCEMQPEQIFELSVEKGFVDTAASILLLSSRNLPSADEENRSQNSHVGDIALLQRDHVCALRLFAAIFKFPLGNTAINQGSRNSTHVHRSDIPEEHRALALSIFRFASDLENVIEEHLGPCGMHALPGTNILSQKVRTIMEVCHIFQLDFDWLIL